MISFVCIRVYNHDFICTIYVRVSLIRAVAIAKARNRGNLRQIACQTITNTLCRKGRKPICRRQQGTTSCIGTRPYHIQSQITRRILGRCQAFAFLHRHVATFCGLPGRFFALRNAVKVVGIFLALTAASTKETGIVPGNACHDAFSDIDNGGQIGIDTTFGRIVIHPQEAQGLMRSSTQCDIVILPNCTRVARY
jgi:hypothetical protein